MQWPGTAKVMFSCSQGKYNESIQAFDKAIELDPKHAYPWYNKGNALNNLGKYNEAVLAYNKAIEINPQYADAWNNKGDALYNLGKYNETIKALDRAIQLDPKYTPAWIGKGATLVAWENTMKPSKLTIKLLS